MSRSSEAYLEDILEAAHRIREYISNVSRVELETDRKTLDAVIWNLAMIGEAVKHLPAEIRDSQPGVPWKRVAGLRDVLIHTYFAHDFDLIWQIVTVRVPELVPPVTAILAKLQADEAPPTRASESAPSNDAPSS